MLLEASVKRLSALSLAVAALEVVLREEDGAAGFRTVSRMAVILTALRMLTALLS